MYGASIAYIVLTPQLSRERAVEAEGKILPTFSRPKSSNPLEWVSHTLRHVSAAVELGGMSVAGVGLLSLLTAPLPLGLLAYHAYLVWAGMTTNESDKWADLREDMRDGTVYVGRILSPSPSQVTMGSSGGSDATGHLRSPMRRGGDSSRIPAFQAESKWPIRSRQALIRTDHAQPADVLHADFLPHIDAESWKLCWTLTEVENVYDLGFWNNLKEVFS